MISLISLEFKMTCGTARLNYGSLVGLNAT